MPASISVFLSDHDRGELEGLLRSGKTEQRLLRRIGIVLAFAKGLSVKKVAGQCGCTMETAGLWRDRLVQDGLPGLADAPGRGRMPKYIGDEEAKIIAATLEAPEDETHWCARRLATKVKASKSTVQRIWNRDRLQPHLQKTFKHGNDPQLVEEVVDVVGLYLNPPDKALVLSIDEKSRIQALNRTQPLLPLKFGHRSAVRTTTNATERPPSLRRSTLVRARWWGNARKHTSIQISSVFSESLTRRIPKEKFI